MNEPPKESVVIREMKDCKTDILKFQIGQMIDRAISCPVYEGTGARSRLTGHQSDSSQMIKVFHLSGYGKTLVEAKYRRLIP